MFLDEAIIAVQAGSGGHGCTAWRREKYVAKGGPAGGDGGHGGNVVFIADSNTDTLAAYASRKRFEAQKGQPGSGSNKTGASGEDLVLKVPPGTIIEDREQNVLVADLKEHGDQVLVAKGGRGGYGNAHFKSSVRQRPDFAEKGEPGEEKRLQLELKLVADIGIIGLPSVGKSTLISVVSAAKPKIAEYHFTTLVPNLGVVNVDDRSFVVCDVPGLIEGASEGKGLGDQFLKHIERCGVLLHVLDATHIEREGDVFAFDQVLRDYRSIRRELEHYSPTLVAKKELVVLNKIDVFPEEERSVIGNQLSEVFKNEGMELFACISAATQGGTADLMKQLLPIVLNEREVRLQQQETDDIPVLTPHLEDTRMGAYRIEFEEPELLRVVGTRIEQLVIMTDFSSEGGVRRLKDVLERTGLRKAISRAKREYDCEDASVFIGQRCIDSLL